MLKFIEIQSYPATITQSFTNVDCFVMDTYDSNEMDGASNAMPTVYVQAILYVITPIIVGITCLVCFVPYCRAKKPDFE